MNASIDRRDRWIDNSTVLAYLVGGIVVHEVVLQYTPSLLYRGCLVLALLGGLTHPR